MFNVMPCRRWPPLIFALVFIFVVSHSCFAGPMRKPLFCTQDEPPLPFPTPLAFLTNPFPRPVPLPVSPITMFRLDEINLTHVTTPPEFRVHDPKAADARGVPCPPSTPWLSSP